MNGWHSFSTLPPTDMAKVRSKMMKGTFIGNDSKDRHLKGKTALIRSSPSLGVVLAQFDDTSLTEAFGWFEFFADDFAFNQKEETEE